MDLKIEEEGQAPWEQMTERGKGETSSSVRQALGMKN